MKNLNLQTYCLRPLTDLRSALNLQVTKIDTQQEYRTVLNLVKSFFIIKQLFKRINVLSRVIKMCY